MLGESFSGPGINVGKGELLRKLSAIAGLLYFRRLLWPHCWSLIRKMGRVRRKLQRTRRMNRQVDGGLPFRTRKAARAITAPFGNRN